jgi:glycosyltransferase involved in cell wall biosynthesis
MSERSARHVLVYSAQMEQIGGIESHVIEFCLRVSGAGQRVTLLCSRSRIDRLTKDRLRRAGIVLVLNESAFWSASAACKWAWTISALVRLSLCKFDVVYTNGQGRNPATVQQWFRGRARLIHHHHTSCDEGDIALWPPSYRRAMQRADALVVCADFIRKRMQKAIGRDDVDVVYCFSRSVMPPLRVRDPGAPVTLGYFGRLIEAKGVGWILRLSRDARLAGCRWHLWGSEGAYHAKDFESYENVRYRGEFSDEAGLRAALGEIDCFVLFSTVPEGLPVSLMEVMATGKPWIATAQGGIPELAHDPATCVLVDLADYEKVVEACASMEAHIRAGELDHSRQQAFYMARFGDRALLARWLALLEGRDEANGFPQLQQ